METYTENLAEFGSRERKIAAKLLSDDWPEAFYDKNVRIGFNRESGYVFLVNDDFQTAMFNGDTIELWHNTPDHGHEGFLSDLLENLDPRELNQADIDYLIDAAGYEGADLSEKWEPAK